MAKVTQLADDFTGEIGESVQPRKVKLGDVTYHADMSDETYERLVATPLAEFLGGEHVRKTAPESAKDGAESNGTSVDTSRVEDAATRRFGLAHGFEVKDKGRIRDALRKAWNDADENVKAEYVEAVKASA